ncbi:phosphatase PAP2 family protein [Riemerella anatipestifer]|nr:phosphatase PAP2 family protein [Riemerella anatipestifer]
MGAFLSMKKILGGISLCWFSLTFYMLVTLVLVLLVKPDGFFLIPILEGRFYFFAVFLGALFFDNQLKNYPKIKVLVSWLLAYAFLGMVYKETAQLNLMFFDKIDSWLVEIDHLLFGFQPSLEFSKVFDYPWFSELMFLGYFFYYLMPLIVIGMLFKYKPHLLEFFGSLLITAFVIYYTIFIFVPAEGPQFYFPYPSNTVEAYGLFGMAVKQIQLMGEAPTAAFPSSHVGVSVVVLIWLFKHYRKLFFLILPFTFILVFSTVYIKAHYAVDVLAGGVTGVLVYLLSSSITLFFIKKRRQWKSL